MFHLAVIIVVALALYVISAGLAFAAMYRWPNVFKGLVLSRIYSPLEFAAMHSRWFQRAYTEYTHWCYRIFASPAKPPRE